MQTKSKGGTWESHLWCIIVGNCLSMSRSGRVEVMMLVWSRRETLVTPRPRRLKMIKLTHRIWIMMEREVLHS
jgi:hypothetical protein